MFLTAEGLGFSFLVISCQLSCDFSQCWVTFELLQVSQPCNNEPMNQPLPLTCCEVDTLNQISTPSTLTLTLTCFDIDIDIDLQQCWSSCHPYTLSHQSTPCSAFCSDLTCVEVVHKQYLYAFVVFVSISYCNWCSCRYYCSTTCLQIAS